MASQQGGDRSGGISGPVEATAGVIAAIAAVISVLALFGVFSSSTKKPEVPTVPTVPTAPTTPTATTETTPTATGPTKVCQNEVTLEGDASYNLDECKANREGTTGIFEVREKAFKVVSVAKVAEWTGHDPPNASDCISGVGASGAESIKLKRIGQWLCAEGNEHLVIRIRFDSFTPPANSYIEGGRYKFFVDVYEPGKS
jgi:hypothetical protein